MPKNPPKNQWSPVCMARLWLRIHSNYTKPVILPYQFESSAAAASRLGFARDFMAPYALTATQHVSRATIRRNAPRRADEFSLAVPYERLAIPPEAIRSGLVEIFMDVASPSAMRDFAETGKPPIDLRPLKWDGGKQALVGNRRLIGKLTSWSGGLKDGHIELEGADYTSLFIEAKVPVDNEGRSIMDEIDLALPVHKAIQKIVDSCETANGMEVLWLGGDSIPPISASGVVAYRKQRVNRRNRPTGGVEGTWAGIIDCVSAWQVPEGPMPADCVVSDIGAGTGSILRDGQSLAPLEPIYSAPKYYFLSKEDSEKRRREEKAFRAWYGDAWYEKYKKSLKPKPAAWFYGSVPEHISNPKHPGPCSDGPPAFLPDETPGPRKAGDAGAEPAKFKRVPYIPVDAEMTYWDLINDICNGLGCTAEVIDDSLYIMYARTAYDGDFSSYFIEGFNIEDLQWSKDFGRNQVPAVHVTCWDSLNSRRLDARFPTWAEPSQEDKFRTVYGVSSQRELDLIAEAIFYELIRKGVTGSFRSTDLELMAIRSGHLADIGPPVGAYGMGDLSRTSVDDLAGILESKAGIRGAVAKQLAAALKIHKTNTYWISDANLEYTSTAGFSAQLDVCTVASTEMADRAIKEGGSGEAPQQFFVRREIP